MSNVGRPRNYSIEELKSIIDSYVKHTGGSYKINASKVAEYAMKELKIVNFKYYMINRHPEVKQYLLDLNTNILKNRHKTVSIADTAFLSIDVDAYINMGKDRLAEALKNLNTYLEDLADSNANVLRENVNLQNKLDEQISQVINIRKDNEENSNLKKNKEDKLKVEIKVLKQKNDEFQKKIIVLEEAIKILWDEEASKVLYDIGILNYADIEKNDSKMNKLIIEDVNQNVDKVEKDVDRILANMNNSNVISMDFKKKIKDL